ncbi:MAG TPA: carbohydrate-binding family V/XII [Gammaproteobacteria bacterium]|nr:carbohydrate-binding family V/XII [Gammaproteobacteria bacterium]
MQGAKGSSEGGTLTQRHGGCVLAALLVLALGAARAAAADDDESPWPRRIETERGALTIYQPQPEKLDGSTLEGRAAASVTTPGKEEPTFGAFWFTAKVDTDRDADSVVLRDIVVTRVRWPDSAPEDEADVAAFITGLMPKTSIPLSLERFQASLATAESERKSLEDLKHDPPKIVVVEELAELLLYDGEPRSTSIPDTSLEQVVNTTFAVIKDKRDGTYYLSGGSFWYASKDPKGEWMPIASPPPEVAKLVPPDTSSAPVPEKPPKIVVATEPTELIATDGPPSWRVLGSGELMYVVNTETPVVRDIAGGDVFVLLSGRWYRAATLAGPWSVVRPDQLPSALEDIPPASDLGAVRVSVAGTPEAEEAMLDAAVPQTAAIDRSKAKLEVEYDGKPQFKRIEGTEVEYATNTASQVLKIHGKYYACDQGVWFVADSPMGEWVVADSIPAEEIKKIPPSSPVYNVTYVTIYESTPSVVYVGYTPGYLWSYPWYGCPVYGTGWYYPPYWGAAYYPRPATFGMHVSYNPYTGWGMGFTYSTGFLTIGVGFGGGYGGYYRPGYPVGPYYRPLPYYPPGGYRRPYYEAGQRPGAPRATPYADGTRRAAATGEPGAGSRNLYNDARTRERVAPADQQRTAGLQQANRPGSGPNNVYADRNGNVYRQTDQGWEAREQREWQAADSSRSAGATSGPASAGGQGGRSSAQTGATPSQSGATRASPSSSGTTRASPSSSDAGTSSQSAARASPQSQSGTSRSGYEAPSNLGRDYEARQYGASRSAARSMPRGGGGRRR